MKALILSINSDIGIELSKALSLKGYEVFGTYNNIFPNKTIPEDNLLKLNIKNYNSTKYKNWLKFINKWDVFISCVGTQAPGGKMDQVDLSKWVDSVAINSTYQIAALINAMQYRNKEDTPTVIFFAGGGTNSATAAYSAYTIGKISLIKTIELLDYEFNDTKFAIIGPGWVKTKIHNETIKAKAMAGENFVKTLEMLKSPSNFNPMEKVIQDTLNLISLPKDLVGGRNFSSVHDDMSVENLKKLNIIDKDFYKLRRNLNNASPKI